LIALRTPGRFNDQRHGADLASDGRAGNSTNELRRRRCCGHLYLRSMD
jgi:hypothetical protein